MWGNLAGKVGAQDWGNALQKIGNAVAPLPGEDQDDDDDEYYDSEEEEEEEEYDEDDEEEEEESRRPAFGFVGLLARALDKGDEDNEDQEQDAEDTVEYQQQHTQGPGNDEPPNSAYPPQDVPNEQEEQPFTSADEQSSGSRTRPPKKPMRQISPMPTEEEAPDQAETHQDATDEWNVDEDMGDYEVISSKAAVLNEERQMVAETTDRLPKATSDTTIPSPQPDENSRSQQTPEKLHGSEFPSTPRGYESISLHFSQHPPELSSKPKLPPAVELAAPQQETVPPVRKNDVEDYSFTGQTSGMKETSPPLLSSDVETKTKDKSTLDSPARWDQKEEHDPDDAAIQEPSLEENTPERPSVHRPGIPDKPPQEDSQPLFSTSSPEPPAVSEPTVEEITKETNSPATDVEWEFSARGEDYLPTPTETSQDESQIQRPHEDSVNQSPNDNAPPPRPSPSIQTSKPNPMHEQRLREAEETILALQLQLQHETEKSSQLTETLMIQFQEKEARLMEASSEEYQHERAQLEYRYQSEIQELEKRLADEKKEFVTSQQKLLQDMERSHQRAEQAEAKLQDAVKKHENQLAQASRQEQRSVRVAEEKLAKTMALLDDRDEQIAELKKTIHKLESHVDAHEEGVEEVEQEVEELQIENDELHEKVEKLESKCNELKEKITKLEDESHQLRPLKMELTMMREERDRERAKNQSMVQSTMTSHSQVESERDAALAELRDVKQQLSATLADLEVAKADQERILRANANLQSALEAFQDERQAEMNMLDEQRLESEEAIKMAHNASVEAMKQTHDEEIRQVQMAADAALKHVQNEADELRGSLQKLKTENMQTRRALDEAIHRLQTTQEDVIDRTLMKNILLDWCTMKEKEKRHQVLQLMASVLHFSDEEKEKVHLTHLDIDSVRSKFVGALAAPLPPSKARLEQLKGDNVSEKWINFLLAETDDS